MTFPVCIVVVFNVSSATPITPTTFFPSSFVKSYFIAYPGIEEGTSKSPRWIGPFSNDTFIGTRPTSAMTAVFSVFPLPTIIFGFVEITPDTA